MIHRFSDAAKESLNCARKEAQRLNHDYLAPEHMLLGLIRDEKNSAVAILVDMGVDHATVRAATEQAVARGKTVEFSQFQFTPSAKKALEAAMDEASRLGDTYIGTMHLVLGLLAERTNIAAQVLTNAGVGLEQFRSRARARVDSERQEAPHRHVATSANESRTEVRRLLHRAEELLRELEQYYLAEEVGSVKARLESPSRDEVSELLALLTSARVALEKRGESTAAKAIEAAIVQIVKQR
jgi:ATP-dependent Clp protease ATP-binding subunit ClpA